MKYIFPILFFVLFSSCSEEKKKDNDYTYFGGEIINPNDEYVLLYKKNKLIDSIKLDDNNRFLVKIDDFEEGLYKFYHSPEYQHMKLAKGDSVLLRLNTLEFDETLVFTGIGAEKNNFLIDLYLLHDKEERFMYNKYDLDHTIFKQKVDSLRKEKKDKLNKFIYANTSVSPEFKSFINEVINYTHYRYWETYQHVFYNKNKDQNAVPKSYYTYRDSINLNHEELSYFVPYMYYVTQYINNEAYSECLQKMVDSGKNINTSLTYNINKLKLIDSMISNSYLKNELLRLTAFSYFRYNNNNVKKNDDFYQLFKKITHDKKSVEEIYNLHLGISNLQKGNYIPKIRLIDQQGQITSTKAASAKKGKDIYYFWLSSHKKHKQYINGKIQKLLEEFPDLNVVGISLDNNQRVWKNNLKTLSLPLETQYRAEKLETLEKDFAIININKFIIVDENGRIIDAFSSTTDPELKNKLK